jgi:hypothetical protein
METKNCHFWFQINWFLCIIFLYFQTTENKAGLIPTAVRYENFHYIPFILLPHSFLHL